MNDDPQRWKLDAHAPEQARALLQSVTTPPMSDADRAAILAAITTAAGPNAAHAPSAAATSAASPAVLVLGAVTALAVVVGLVGMGWKEGPRARERGRPVEAEVASAQSSLPAPRAAAASPAELLPPRSPSPADLRRTATAVAPTTVAAMPAGANADTLALESALVGRARQSTDATAALAALDEHARRFPRGELGPEREYLAVKALRRLGRADEAKARARHFLSAYPRSPYTPAVRTLLAELEAP